MQNARAASHCLTNYNLLFNIKYYCTRTALTGLITAENFPAVLKTAAWRIALQIVRTSFLGPRPCFSPPPPL